MNLKDDESKRASNYSDQEKKKEGGRRNLRYQKVPSLSQPV